MNVNEDAARQYQVEGIKERYTAFSNTKKQSRMCSEVHLPVNQKSQLYTADSNRVPHYFIKPGPGHYEVDAEAICGGKSTQAKYMTSPSAPISRRSTVGRLRTADPSQSGKKRKKIGQKVEDNFVDKEHQLPHNRFFFEEGPKKCAEFIQPTWDQTEADKREAGFTQFPLQDPFPVKEWTATRCQHAIESHPFSDLKVSLLSSNLTHFCVQYSVPKGPRKASVPLNRKGKPGYPVPPGPGEYQRILVGQQLNENALCRDWGLSGKKSFHAINQAAFAKYKRDTMHVTEFAHEFDKFNANRIGPGPGAY